MSHSVDGSTFTDDERAHLRAAAGILAAIAEARGVVPGLNNKSIADILGWSHEKTTAVARGLARTGLMAKASHIDEVVKRARESSGPARYERAHRDDR